MPSDSSSSLLETTQLLFMLLPHATTCLPGFPHNNATTSPLSLKSPKHCPTLWSCRLARAFSLTFCLLFPCFFVFIFVAMAFDCLRCLLLDLPYSLVGIPTTFTWAGALKWPKLNICCAETRAAYKQPIKKRRSQHVLHCISLAAQRENGKCRAQKIYTDE